VLIPTVGSRVRERAIPGAITTETIQSLRAKRILAGYAIFGGTKTINLEVPIIQNTTKSFLRYMTVLVMYAPYS
jgi:hypothetical protein